MSLSVQSAGQASPSSTAQAVSSALPVTTEAPKASASFGSAPAAAVSLSAQAKVAQAKALAIKTGHDPDGIQDGK